MVNNQKMVELTEEDIKDPVLFQVGFLNTEPFGKQIDVLRCKAKHIVLCCGRRGGKTRLIAGEIIRGAVIGDYKKQFVVCPVYRNIKPIFNQIDRYLADSGLINDVDKITRSSPQYIKFKNGSEIEFGSTERPHTLRGEGYHRIFRDESGFIKRDADKVLRPMMFDFDADIWDTSTPWGKDTTYYENYMRGLSGGNSRIKSFHWTSLDNPHLQRKVVEEEIEEYGEDSFYVQAEIFGNFIDDVDSYFKQTLIDACVDENYKMVTEDFLVRGG